MQSARSVLVAGLSVAALSLSGSAASAQSRVEPNSKVYIEPSENGMHTALAGALRKKKVPVILVTSPEAAQYVINVVGEYKKAGWAKTLMSGGGARGEANASMTVEDREKKEIVFAYNVDKGNAARGIQSAAESCAKHLGNHIKGKD